MLHTVQVLSHTFIHLFILYTFIRLRLPVLYTVPATVPARWNVQCCPQPTTQHGTMWWPCSQQCHWYCLFCCREDETGQVLVQHLLRVSNFLSNDSFGFNNKSNCFVKRFNRLLQFLYLMRRHFFPFPFSCRGFAACLFRRFVHVHVLASTKKV